jgi:hypothetical protein
VIASLYNLSFFIGIVGGMGCSSACRILVGKPEGKGPLGRPRRRWVDNITIDLRNLEWEEMEWIDLAQGRVQWRAFVNTVMNLRFP